MSLALGVFGLFAAVGGGFFSLRGAGFSLASAWRLRGAGVAPVRGGTYFSLPRQRKVGKRKPPKRYLVLSVCRLGGTRLNGHHAHPAEGSETRSPLAPLAIVTRQSSVPAGFAAERHNPFDFPRWFPMQTD